MLLTNFESIYRRIFNSIDNPSLKGEDIRRIIDSDCSLTYSPNFFCIVDIAKLSIDYVSKNMHACLGMNENSLINNGLSQIWSRIHPKDISCLSNSLSELIEYLEKDPPLKNTEQFSYSWNYRFQKNDKSYINIIQNTTPFYLNSSNEKKGFTYFTVLHSRQTIPIQASILGLNKNHDLETKYFTNCSLLALLKKVSDREKDIIRLLSKEYTSKSIGKKLFISSNTVDTHRRNILRKLKLSSTGELINIIKTQQNLI